MTERFDWSIPSDDASFGQNGPIKSTVDANCLRVDKRLRDITHDER